MVEVNGGFTVKTYHKEHGCVFLLPANPDKELLEDTALTIFCSSDIGVATVIAGAFQPS